MPIFPIICRDDIQKIEAKPYADFMPHTSVYDGLNASAEKHGKRKALTFITSADPAQAAENWTYAEFMADIRRAANLFAHLANGAEPRIAMLLPAIPEAYLTLFGGETAGVVCPINYLLDAEHIADLVKASGATVLVALGPNAELDIWSRATELQSRCPDLQHLLAVGGAPGALDFHVELKKMDASSLVKKRQIHAQSIAALFHTGGTTGKPKLAQHTHGNQLHAAWGAANMYGTQANDVVINGFPLFHVAGSFVYGLSTLLAGGEVVLPTLLGMRNKGFVERYWDFAEKHSATLLAAVPTVMSALMNVPTGRADITSVRALFTGGSPLPDELAANFERRFGIPVRNILGMTECAGVIAIEPMLAERIPGSCGLALPFTRVFTVTPDGQKLAPASTGILCVKGPNVGPGYTESARNQGTFTEDGGLITGDIGHVDHDGRVFITGRAKDLIIRSSHNIDPQVIENALLSHPDVLMAAAVGAPDEYAGEMPVAFVTLKPGSTLTEAELSDFANKLIPERPAYPKRIDFLGVIPLTAIGKIYKPALKIMAIERVIKDRLEASGLASKLTFRIVEEAPKIILNFTLNTTDDEISLTESLKQLMSSFALPYKIIQPRLITP
jgi:fatty-acyl-CoA synthase